ncbi:MAG: peptidylprolyl isomerase, partial [Ottowia sp.]|nr:peptidylprolyl isomerase [Ottowia sp.]
IPAGEAFGERNPDMIQWLARKELDAMGDPQERYAVGDVIHLPTPDGQGQFAAVVQAVRDDGALRLDFNHPLAGQPVTFEVQVIGVL